MDGPEQDPRARLSPLLTGLQQDLEGELGLTALAREAGLSPFHFHRRFAAAIGETPKQHVERLRLERAAYKLAITSDTVLQVALSVGYRSHETFTRAFRRRYGCTPLAWRRSALQAQKDRLERNRGFRGEGCTLSEVVFRYVPDTPLLSVRRLGAYADIGAAQPFTAADTIWKGLADWAESRRLAHGRLAMGLFHDDPTLTPPQLQRCDACLPLAAAPGDEPPVPGLLLAGGIYGVIEHRGPYWTIAQAYRNLADAVRASGTYVFREDPFVQVWRFVDPEDRAADLTEVWAPVRRAR